MLDGKLRINPSLPDGWSRLSYEIFWKGERLRVDVRKGQSPEIKSVGAL